MSDTQDPLERAYYAMIDAETARGKAEQAYEQAVAEETYEYIAEWCDNGVWAPIEIEMFDGVFPNLTAARGYIKVAKTRGGLRKHPHCSPPRIATGGNQ